MLFSSPNLNLYSRCAPSEVQVCCRQARSLFSLRPCACFDLISMAGSESDKLFSRLFMFLRQFLVLFTREHTPQPPPLCTRPSIPLRNLTTPCYATRIFCAKSPTGTRPTRSAGPRPENEWIENVTHASKRGDGRSTGHSNPGPPGKMRCRGRVSKKDAEKRVRYFGEYCVPTLHVHAQCHRELTLHYV